MIEKMTIKKLNSIRVNIFEHIIKRYSLTKKAAIEILLTWEKENMIVCAKIAYNSDGVAWSQLRNKKLQWLRDNHNLWETIEGNPHFDENKKRLEQINYKMHDAGLYKSYNYMGYVSVWNMIEKIRRES